ncbi:hypothetical protein ACLQ2R_05455 [Streptosporangium sp. DT93]|uniref:hypothetical protein n=1 Tax=Streptosporangium sp. DT93 TaxID=3393428 RepID=UPI003CEDB2D0
MREGRAEDARIEARRLIRDLLGEERPEAALLLRQAEEVLGADRVARAVELARGAPLTRRSTELAAVAALVVGTRELGEVWWRRERGGKLPAPDEVLQTSTAVDPWTDLTVLEMLAAWIADDAADQAWGRAAAVTDLNSWQAEDRVELPADTRSGTRILVSFDAGGRLDAVVVRRPDGAMGSDLDFDSLRYSRPAEAQWSWGVAAGLGPHRLDERPDPYEQSVDGEAAETLHAWALRHGASAEQTGTTWRTRGDVIAAIERIDWMWRSGEWFAWWRGVSALIDGEPEQLTARLAEIADAP